MTALASRAAYQAKTDLAVPLNMLQLDYILQGHGWAWAIVGDGTNAIEFKVSFLYDSLNGLAQATSEILLGASESKCALQQEPGEHRLLFAREEQVIRITVESFHQTFSRRRHGDVVMSMTSEPVQLAEEVLNCLFRVFVRHGEEEYLKLWQMAPFPMAGYLKLQQVRDHLAR